MSAGNLTPGYRWNDAAQRYINSATGQFVSATTIHNALQATISNATSTAASLADSLRSGQITLAQWQLGMAEQIKSTHLASAALAKGGWAQMTPSDFGRVGQKVREQYGYLNRLAGQIADGTQPLDGRFRERCKLYVKAGKETYQAVQQREMAKAGYDQERNHLNGGDHCGGCEEETARGWVGIGELVPIGGRDCHHNCLCEIEYGRSAA